MTTINDLLTLALTKAGVTGQGRTPSQADMSSALLELNMMLAQWQKQRWLVWGLVDTGHTCTGAPSYSVGPGGDFNLPYRPDKIEASYIRQFGVTSQSNPIATTYLQGPGNPSSSQIPLGSCIDWLNTTTGYVERWCNVNGTPVLIAAQPDLQA